MSFPIGSMSVGTIISKSFSLLIGRIQSFYLINLIVYLPAFLLAIGSPVLQTMVGAGAPIAQVMLALLSIGLVIILQPIGTSAILYIVGSEYIGRKVSLGDAMNFAMGRFGDLIITGLIAGCMVMLGFVFCIVPGIILALRYMLATQVVIFENLSGFSALKRSSQLTTGHQWRVVGILLLVGLGTGIANAIIQGVLGSVLPQGEFELIGGKMVLVNIIWINFLVHTFLSWMIQVFFTTFQSVASTLVYLDIRARSESQATMNQVMEQRFSS